MSDIKTFVPAIVDSCACAVYTDPNITMIFSRREAHDTYFDSSLLPFLG